MSLKKSSISTQPTGYDIELFDAAPNGVTHKFYSNEEIDNLTPPGELITASKEEIIAKMLKAAKRVRKHAEPMVEAVGRHRIIYN